MVGESLCALTGVHSIALSGLALLAPGWALAPLLPGPLRRHRLASAMAAPALGIAAVAATLITLARIGIPLTGVSVRLALLALVAIGFLVSDRPAPPRRPITRGDLIEALCLLAIVILSVILALQVAGSTIVPGNDWAKYLLYADEIRRHGTLLIKNPFWMLGVPFRDDPGGPALYGAALVMSRAPTGQLNHGILVFSVLEVVTVFAFVRAFWGRAAGILAAAIVAVVPASQDILGWEGVANLIALVLLVLLLAFLAAYATGELDRRGKVGLAVTLIGVPASHRLSGTIAVAVAGLVVLACLAFAEDRRRVLRDAVQIAVATIVLGFGVFADLYAREKTFGGSLPYTDYLGSKVNLSLAVRDVSPWLVVALLVALVVIALRRRRERTLWPAIALLGVAVVLAYIWIVHVPNYYSRMVFYLPPIAAALVAAVVVRVRRPALVATASLAVLIVVTIGSFEQAKNVRSYYAFVNPAALRGLDALTAVLRPGEVVVTDRCWSFLGEWLLSTRTLAALAPEDIQPKAELVFADKAESIINGTPSGRRLARRLGVHYLLVDPTCPAAKGGLLPAPTQGRPIFESDRLAIIRLPAGG